MQGNEVVFPALDPNIYPALDPSSSSSSVPLRPAPPRALSANSLSLLSEAVSNLSDLADFGLEHIPRNPVNHLPGPRHTHPCCPPPPVYVLAADGSHLYLLDSSKLSSPESPPPYAPFRSSRARAATYAGRIARSPIPSSPISSSPSSPHPAYGTFGDDETQATLGTTLRTIVRGERPIALAPDEEDPEAGRVPSTWSRFWAPVGDGEAWRSLVHLICINLPSNLLIWPPLLVGTLAGTVLLITLPIGAVVWWLTLIIARWAAREELRLQSRFHGVDIVHHRPRPIFHRLRERPRLQHSPHVRSVREVGVIEIEMVRDTRFLNNSWAMFSDHYSYAALAYFLLIKPVTILLPTILLVALLPVCVVLFPLLPIYLRAARVYGHAQAGVAADNL